MRRTSGRPLSALALALPILAAQCAEAAGSGRAAVIAGRVERTPGTRLEAGLVRVLPAAPLVRATETTLRPLGETAIGRDGAFEIQVTLNDELRVTRWVRLHVEDGDQRFLGTVLVPPRRGLSLSMLGPQGWPKPVDLSVLLPKLRRPLGGRIGLWDAGLEKLLASGELLDNACEVELELIRSVPETGREISARVFDRRGEVLWQRRFASLAEVRRAGSDGLVIDTVFETELDVPPSGDGEVRFVQLVRPFQPARRDKSVPVRGGRARAVHGRDQIRAFGWGDGEHPVAYGAVEIRAETEGRVRWTQPTAGGPSQELAVVGPTGLPLSEVEVVWGLRRPGAQSPDYVLVGQTRSTDVDGMTRITPAFAGEYDLKLQRLEGTAVRSRAVRVRLPAATLEVPMPPVRHVAIDPVVPEGVQELRWGMLVYRPASAEDVPWKRRTVSAADIAGLGTFDLPEGRWVLRLEIGGLSGSAEVGPRDSVVQMQLR